MSYENTHTFVFRNFIGPASNTITEFWRMIWQEKCSRIVMLTNLHEFGVVSLLVFNVLYVSGVNLAKWGSAKGQAEGSSASDIPETLPVSTVQYQVLQTSLKMFEGYFLYFAKQDISYYLSCRDIIFSEGRSWIHAQWKSCHEQTLASGGFNFATGRTTVLLFQNIHLICYRLKAYL